MQKMTVVILINPDGQVTAEVVEGAGPKCVTEVLAGLEALLGEAAETRLKPEYEWDAEALRLMQQQEVQS